MSVYRAQGISTSRVGALINPGIRPGDVVAVRNGANLTGACPADTMLAYPCFVDEAVPFAGIQISVGVAVAAVLGKLALYRFAARNQLGALVEACAGTADMNSTANTIIQLDFAAPRILPIDWYWLVAKFNGAAQPHSAGLGFSGTSGFMQAVRPQSLGPYVRSVGAGETVNRASVASAYADAFPTTATLTIAGNATSGSPIMGLKAAP